MQGQIELRPLAHETTGKARQKTIGERRQNRNAQCACPACPDFVSRLSDPVKPDERPLDLAIKRRALGRGHKPRAAFLEKFEAQPVLQIPQQAAHRGLGDPHHAGGDGDAPCNHQATEGFDLADIWLAHGQAITLEHK